MFFTQVCKMFISLVVVVVIFWSGMIPYLMPIAAVNSATAKQSNHAQNYYEALSLKSTTGTNWDEIDQYLVEAIKLAHESTEEYANAALEKWVDELMRKVDTKFLDWYFSYGNQKAMEFGVPFAWAAFELDSFLKVMRQEDEKDLNTEEIIKKRMIEDFNSKFSELVLDKQAEDNLKSILEQLGRNHASAMGFKFSVIKAQYQIPNQDWDEHLLKIAELVDNTGTSKYSLSAQSINSNLFTKVIATTTAIVGIKLAAKFAAKAGSKLLAKAGASIIAQTGAQLLDPILAVGFLVWDVWDYQGMVANSKPELSKNIFDYLTELRLSILYAPENSITAAIEEVERKLLNALESQPV
ncbi:hypothetical protein [uncultured Nostoc sp.]|uniref:hypothetical protein n=1 Tax=uncultured Nostoc sp. TaxID=340711 RepID=UPI0035CC99FE